jgi:hypothetical protein
LSHPVSARPTGWCGRSRARAASPCARSWGRDS